MITELFEQATGKETRRYMRDSSFFTKIHNHIKNSNLLIRERNDFSKTL